MATQANLYERSTPVGRGRGDRGGSRLSKENGSFGPPKRGRRKNVLSSPRGDTTPEGPAEKGMSTRSSREDSRLMGEINRDSLDVNPSPTPVKTPKSPLSPHSALLREGRAQDPTPKAKPLKSSSFPEKFVRLPGSRAYIDMTSIPTKGTARLVIWIAQQLGHFYEDEDLAPVPVAVVYAPSTAAARPETATPVTKTTGPAAEVTTPATDTASPGPESSKRAGLRSHQSGKRVRYDEDPNDPFSDRQQTEEGPAANGHQGEAREAHRDERPRTRSQKEIYRRNWAVEHDVYPKFCFDSDEMATIFEAFDPTVSKTTLDLGTSLVNILRSTSFATTMEEEAILLRDFTSAIKRTVNNHEALLDAFLRLARLPVIQRAVVAFLEQMGKPEIKEFGPSGEFLDEQVSVQPPPKRGRGRPRKADTQPGSGLKEVITNSQRELALIHNISTVVPEYKPYSTPYPNLTAATGPFESQGSQADASTAMWESTSAAVPPERAQNVLNPSQIDSLLKLASGGSTSDDEEDDAGNLLQAINTDLQMTVLLHRHIRQLAAEGKAGIVPADWTMLPFVMSLADPSGTQSPAARLATLQRRLEDFLAAFVKPTVNTVMGKEQAVALSGIYRYMAARMAPSPFRSIYEFEPSSGGGSTGGNGGGGGRGLGKEELDAIKEDVQRSYDERRLRKEVGGSGGA